MYREEDQFLLFEDDEQEEVYQQEKKKYDLELEACNEELKLLLKNKKFRKWVWHVLEKCGIFDSMSYAIPQQMAILSGKRDIGLFIIDEIERANEGILGSMQTEFKERLNNE